MRRLSRPNAVARIEIWQCDVNGHYLHTRDNNAVADSSFQGFGHAITGSDGVYEFITIKPVPYPGRTPHIHVKAFANDKELTTQFYLNDHRRMIATLSMDVYQMSKKRLWV